MRGGGNPDVRGIWLEFTWGHWGRFAKDERVRLWQGWMVAPAKEGEGRSILFKKCILPLPNLQIVGNMFFENIWLNCFPSL